MPSITTISEFLNQAVGNRGAEEMYSRKHQAAMGRTDMGNPGPVAQPPAPQQ